MFVQLMSMLVSAPILVAIAAALLLRRPIASQRATAAMIALMLVFTAVSVRDWWIVQDIDYGFSYVGVVIRVGKLAAVLAVLYVVMTEGGDIPARTESQETRESRLNDTQARQHRRDMAQDAREVRQR